MARLEMTVTIYVTDLPAFLSFHSFFFGSSAEKSGSGVRVFTRSLESCTATFTNVLIEEKWPSSLLRSMKLKLS